MEALGQDTQGRYQMLMEATHLGCLPRLCYVFNLKSTDVDGTVSQIRKRRTLLRHGKVVAVS